MNHFMLPSSKEDGQASLRYGDCSVRQLVEKMLVMGSLKENLEAKVFGGAKQFSPCEEGFQIGKSNIQIARDMLKAANIQIVNSHTGGVRGRKLRFNTSTGKVLMKLL